ncbi:rhodopsin [Cherax quadricarinatus]|nr:rhodopsin-like [Cherax quadricarinatus]XP_053651572.1 rhodopsin-like [Cherax quadricarinatus]XP_053651579.1 rhodopsin-like [Cherax quadricarinatus]
MNVTVNCSEACPNCNETGDIPQHFLISPYLLLAALVHCWGVIILGFLSNVVALWCVHTCNKTKPAMKILLGCVFVPLLLLCVINSSVAQYVTAILTCDLVTFSSTVIVVMHKMFDVLVQMEVISIAAVSFFRLKAIWSPHGRIVQMKTVVTVVTCVTLYTLLTTVGLMVPLGLGYLTAPGVKQGLTILFVLNTFLPILATILCYTLMVFTMCRNQRRLASSQHSSSVHRADATRSMLAVFLSNLFFTSPVPLFYFQNDRTFTLEVTGWILFTTHFTMDPVVFVLFNPSFRHRVGERVGASLTWMTHRCSRTSLTTTSTTSTTYTPPDTVFTDQFSVTVFSDQSH